MYQNLKEVNELNSRLQRKLDEEMCQKAQMFKDQTLNILSNNSRPADTYGSMRTLSKENDHIYSQNPRV